MPGLRRRRERMDPCPRCERLETLSRRQAERIRELERKVDELSRAAKRQSAPFSKGEPKRNPRTPGRKRDDSRPRVHRAIPERVDDVVPVPLPQRCPGCAGELSLERIAMQHQIDLPPPEPLVLRYEIQVGRCRCCGMRVQPRDGSQISDALGAAGVQLGPRALALSTLINKELGVSHAKTARILAALGVEVSRSGICRGIGRVGALLEPTYDAIADTIAAAPVVSPDETGWRIGGERARLWVAVCATATMYQVAKGRGFEQVKALLGEDFAGVLCRDGWAPYRCLAQASHQTCYAHLLRRCAEMIEGSRTRAKVIPRTLAAILVDALALRDARDAGALSQRTLTARIRALERRVEELLAQKTRNQANARLLRHIAAERAHLFTFLTNPNVDATNYRAEQAIRPAVTTRKVSGGNRTSHGAHVFEIIVSAVRTARQQGIDAIEMIIDRLRDPTWRVAPQLALVGNASPR